MSDLINLIVAAIIAFVTGTGGTAIVNWVLNRQGRKAEAARQIQAEEEAKQLKERSRTERAEMLAEAQATAQRTALNSAHDAYQQVESRCNKCLRELEQVRRREDRRDRAQDALLDAVVEIVPLLDANDERTTSLRAAIRTARQARYDYYEDDVT